MTRIYFPGCKIRAKYPEASRRMIELVREHGMADEVTGCCRTNHQSLRPEDTAVCICCNCMAMIDEDAANERMDYLYALIDADPSFPLPDWSGLELSVQDCGRAWDRPELHDAVRSLLAKMNVRVTEAPDAREKTTFCGVSGLTPVPEQDASFAPRRYTVEAPARGLFANAERDASEAMREHAAHIPADVVACYCTACHDGLALGGKHAVNMIELVCGTAQLNDLR